MEWFYIIYAFISLVIALNRGTVYSNGGARAPLAVGLFVIFVFFLWPVLFFLLLLGSFCSKTLGGLV